MTTKTTDDPGSCALKGGRLSDRALSRLRVRCLCPLLSLEVSCRITRFFLANESGKSQLGVLAVACAAGVFSDEPEMDGGTPAFVWSSC